MDEVCGSETGLYLPQTSTTVLTRPFEWFQNPSINQKPNNLSHQAYVIGKAKPNVCKALHYII